MNFQLLLLSILTLAQPCFPASYKDVATLVDSMIFDQSEKAANEAATWFDDPAMKAVAKAIIKEDLDPEEIEIADKTARRLGLDFAQILRAKAKIEKKRQDLRRKEMLNALLREVAKGFGVFTTKSPAVQFKTANRIPTKINIPPLVAIDKPKTNDGTLVAGKAKKLQDGSAVAKPEVLEDPVTKSEPKNAAGVFRKPEIPLGHVDPAISNLINLAIGNAAEIKRRLESPNVPNSNHHDLFRENSESSLIEDRIHSLTQRQLEIRNMLKNGVMHKNDNPEPEPLETMPIKIDQDLRAFFEIQRNNDAETTTLATFFPVDALATAELITITPIIDAYPTNTENGMMISERNNFGEFITLRPATEPSNSNSFSNQMKSNDYNNNNFLVPKQGPIDFARDLPSSSSAAAAQTQAIFNQPFHNFPVLETDLHGLKNNLMADLRTERTNFGADVIVTTETKSVKENIVARDSAVKLKKHLENLVEWKKQHLPLKK
ncbi:unnamed protein product [Notodromas monacha]|uniref:Uncharacterized protein n=1 Tax=Notodromas monacha TaxID=399045 RepID=A0A7R9GFF2_9CRUS|nr:unnamed protein product [Notodromas monacha]CAG0919086.1 unnamed protein product [Notodromas monacha]